MRCCIIILRSSIALAAMMIALLSGCAADPAVSPSARAVLSRPASGFIPVEGGRIWYSVRGGGGGGGGRERGGMRTPLLVLHGGPGIPHDYLENLELLSDERPVIFYDQLGCGLSDRPDDPSLWNRERFARELDQARSALGLDEVILYGHSWGSILAVDYLSGLGGSSPVNVRGVILAGPALSVPRWVADSRGLIAALGPDVSKAIFDAERSGQTDSKAYQEAMQLFYSRYVCRLDPWPEPLNRAMEGMGVPVNMTMSGPSEFTVTGSLKNVDVTPQLRALTQPILFICGEHDEATPATTRYYASIAAHARVVVIANAAHIANYDQPEPYMAALRAWFRQNDF